MTSIHTWSKTASENDDADSGINWVEGQDPDTVNNSSRAMMGRVAEWRNDISIARATTGAADVYEVTIDSSPAALVDGLLLLIKPHQTNVGSSTLKVNSFGAKPLRAKTATNLSAGDVQINVPAFVCYNLAADEFLLLNSGVFANALFPSLVSTYALNSLLPVGAVLPYPHDTVPAGWLEANGQSLATVSYPELFAKYAYKYGGSGANFNIPDYRGEFLRGYDNAAGKDPDAASRTNRGDGTTGDAVGTKQGQNTGVHGHTASSSTSVSVASGGAHTHQQTNNGYDQDYGVSVIPNTSGTPAGAGSTASSASTQSGGTHTHSASASTTTTVNNSTGSESRGRNVSVMFIVYAKPSAALAEMQGLTGLPYVFDDGVTDTDPGSGRLAWNNADVTSATELYVSEMGPNAEPFGPILSVWDDLGTAVKGYLYITKVGTPTTFGYFSIDSVETDSGVYRKWTVTGLASNGTFADDDNLNVIFTSVGSGEQGIQGPAGVSGGVRFTFDSSTTTAADPGAGDIRLNNAALGSATEISISYSGSDTGSPDYENFIKTWDDSTTLTNRGQILIKKESAVQNFANYRITSAITDGTTYGRFTISHDSSGGTISDTDDLIVEFTRTGDKGASGAGTGDLLAANNLNDVDNASLSRGNLGLAIGTNVQAYAANLTAWAAIATSTKEPALTAASQVEMEAGTETALRSMTPQRVKQAIDALGGSGSSTALSRNFVTNPGIRYSQENGTTPGTASGYFAADQFELIHSQDGTLTVAQVASATPGGSTHRHRMTVTSPDTSIAAAQYAICRQRLEGAQVADFLFGTSGARDMVVSFGCKWPAATYTVTLQNAAADRSYVREFTTTGSDQVVTVVFPGDTTGTWPTGAVHGMTLIWSYAVGSTFQTTADAWQAGNYYGTSSSANGIGNSTDVLELFDVGVYIDPDSTGVAPPFGLPDYGDDLALCKRYYQANLGNGWLQGVVATGGINVSRLGGSLPVEMRVVPSLSLTGTLNIYDASTTATITALGASDSSTTAISFDAAFATGTLVLGRILVCYTGSGKIFMNARM